MTTDQGIGPSATASRNAEVTFWTYVDVRALGSGGLMSNEPERGIGGL